MGLENVGDSTFTPPPYLRYRPLKPFHCNIPKILFMFGISMSRLMTDRSRTLCVSIRRERKDDGDRGRPLWEVQGMLLERVMLTEYWERPESA